VVGSRELEYTGNTDFFVMKLDQNGKKIWAQTYGGEHADTLDGVTATVDNGIVAIGKTRSYGSEQTDLTVMKYDADGKPGKITKMLMDEFRKLTEVEGVPIYE